jgi:hypothetical protein
MKWLTHPEYNMSHPNCQSSNTIKQGLELQPVIVIDNFVADPLALVEDAAVLSFNAIAPFYPGIRSAAPRPTIARLISGVSDLIAETFGLFKPLSEFESWYSLVTTPPQELAPIQRLPHFDSVDPGRIAILHYLMQSEKGGTSFFRHRATGFESVSAERQDRYVAAIDADVARFGMPDPAYIAGDTPLFERIAHYEARFNRAIIYRGNTIHCADIPANMQLASDPRTGRFTINTFIQGHSAPAT